MTTRFNPDKLRAIREKRKLTQYGLAKKINTKRQQITTWENGMARPNIGTIERLCDALRVKPNYFFDLN